MPKALRSVRARCSKAAPVVSPPTPAKATLAVSAVDAVDCSPTPRSVLLHRTLEDGPCVVQIDRLRLDHGQNGMAVGGVLEVALP